MNEHRVFVQTYGKGSPTHSTEDLLSTTLATTNVTWTDLVLNRGHSGQGQRISTCAIKRPCLHFV